MIPKNYTLKIGLYQPTVNYTICCSLIILNTNKDGEQEMLDTWWIYFSDGQTDDESSQDFELGAYGDVRIVASGE